MYMYNKNANLRSESAQTDHRKISQFWAVSHIMGGECTPSKLLHDVHGAGAVASLQHAEDAAVHAFRHVVAVSDEGGGHMQLRSTPVVQVHESSPTFAALLLPR